MSESRGCPRFEASRAKQSSSTAIPW